MTCWRCGHQRAFRGVTGGILLDVTAAMKQWHRDSTASLTARQAQRGDGGAVTLNDSETGCEQTAVLGFCCLYLLKDDGTIFCASSLSPSGTRACTLLSPC
jgi:hypothetical protein